MHVSTFRGSTEHGALLTGTGHQNWGHRSCSACSEVCLEPSHVLSLFTEWKGSALLKTQHLGKANDTIHWLLVRKPQETLLTFPYSDMFFMGYHSLWLRMGHLRHFPLYSKLFLKGRTALCLSASPWNKAKLSQQDFQHPEWEKKPKTCLMSNLHKLIQRQGLNFEWNMLTRSSTSPCEVRHKKVMSQSHN